MPSLSTISSVVSLLLTTYCDVVATATTTARAVVAPRSPFPHHSGSLMAVPMPWWLLDAYLRHQWIYNTVVAPAPTTMSLPPSLPLVHSMLGPHTPSPCLVPFDHLGKMFKFT